MSELPLVPAALSPATHIEFHMMLADWHLRRAVAAHFQDEKINDLVVWHQEQIEKWLEQ